MKSAPTLPLSPEQPNSHRLLRFAVVITGFAVLLLLSLRGCQETGSAKDWDDIPGLAEHHITIPHEGNLYYYHFHNTSGDTWLISGKTSLDRWDESLRARFLPAQGDDYIGLRLNGSDLPEHFQYVDGTHADLVLSGHQVGGMMFKCNYRSSDGQFTLELMNNTRKD
jgi:hypothetical protein